MTPTRSSKRSGTSRCYRAVWVGDFEFCRHPTGLPDVVCLEAREIHTDRRISLWRDQLGPSPPYDIGEDAVFVCFSGMEAELACHLSLGWPLPANVVDLIVEYRMAINGLGGSQRIGMLDACARMGVPIRTTPAEKGRARARILAGWPFSQAERDWILSYCATDVDEECGLLAALMPDALSPWALWRGRFIKSVARMWYRGVPIDQRYAALATDHLKRVKLKGRMVEDTRRIYPIYDDGLVLKNALLTAWMEENGIPVLRTPSGKAASSQEALGSLARDYPILGPLAESLRTQAQLKEFSLPIGSDGRLRAWFAPFMTITSRAAPPTNGYIYNLPAWMRATIQHARPDYALAYLDYKAMEFGLGASCSGDRNMVAFYGSGEPYLATAAAAGVVPATATKKTHSVERDLFKTGVLACMYGIGDETLARRLRRSTSFARRFIEMHHDLFPEYWRWSDGVTAEAIRSGRYCSRHGWTYAVQPPFNMRSLRNWPIQTAGADILRCACILADEQGIEMLATAHDAVLIQAPADRIEAAVVVMADCMRQAARIMTDGFVLNVDHDIKRSGERFIEDRGRRTLTVVDRFLAEGIHA
jgi:DNA polymerase I